MIPMIFAGILTCMAVMMISQAVEIYSFEKADKSNALYFVYLCIAVAIDNFSFACMSVVSHRIILNITWAFAWLSTIFFLSFTISIYVNYTNISKKVSSLCSSVVLYAGVLLYLVDILLGNLYITENPWGHSVKNTSVFAGVAYKIICMIYVASIGYMIFQFAKTCNSKRTKSLLRVLIVSALLVVLGGGVEFIMQFTGIAVFPLHTITYFLMVLMLGIAYKKQSSLTIELEEYNEFLQAVKTEPVAICDAFGKVVFINKCAEIIMIEEKESPIGKYLCDYFEMKGMDTNEFHQNLQGSFIIPAIYRSTRKRCNLSIQNVFDTYGEVFTSIVTVYRLEYTPPILNGGNDNTVQQVAVDYEVTIDTVDANILLVDDSQSGMALLESAMKPYQMKYAKAASGEEAIELIKENAYDMVFLNHMMSGMDGYETSRRIRDLDGEYYKKVPIVLCTSNKIEDSLDDFLHARFSDYIYKPISGKQLSDVLTRWLWTKTAELKKKKKSEKGTLLDIKGISNARVSEYIGNNMKLYTKILTLFVSDMDEKLNDLNQYYQNFELRKIEIYMHAISNACNSIGAIELSSMAGSMEHACKAVNQEYIASNMNGFLEALKQLVESIEEYLKKRSGEP